MSNALQFFIFCYFDNMLLTFSEKVHQADIAYNQRPPNIVLFPRVNATANALLHFLWKFMLHLLAETVLDINILHEEEIYEWTMSIILALIMLLSMSTVLPIPLFGL